MHINRNVLAEYVKIKKLNKSEQRNQHQSEFMGKVYKPPSTNAERGQDLSLTPRKHKFKPNLGDEKQQLSKSKIAIRNK